MTSTTPTGQSTDLLAPLALVYQAEQFIRLATLSEGWSASDDPPLAARVDQVLDRIGD